MRAPLAILAVLVAAGCVEPPVLGVPPIPEGQLALDHDHGDPALHATGAWGFDVVGFADVLGDARGPTAPTDVAVAGDTMIVATVGDEGGFVVVDLADRAAPRVVGRYAIGDSFTYYVEITSDARWAFVTARGQPAAAGPPGGMSLHVVDLADPASPTLAHVVPVLPGGPLTALVDERDEDTFLWVSAHVGEAAYLAGTGAPARVESHRFDPATGRATLLAAWRPPGAPVDALWFPHDLGLSPGPDGPMLTVAYWDGGVWFVDARDPAAPATLASWSEPSPAGARQFHTARVSDVARGGRSLALATPEIFEAPETGLARLLDLGPADAPDPAAAREVASWAPPGELANTMPLLYSPHEFTIRDGVAYVSLFHGGVWALRIDADALTPVGWFFPPLPADWTPDPYSPAAPWFETALAHEDGYVYATDMATGVWILRAVS